MRKSAPTYLNPTLAVGASGASGAEVVWKCPAPGIVYQYSASGDVISEWNSRFLSHTTWSYREQKKKSEK